MSQVVETVEQLLRAFDGSVALSSGAARAIAGGDEQLLARCLRFLIERDEIIVHGDDETIYRRSTLVDEIWRFISTRESTSASAITGALALPDAVCCEILGWLEREGRIRSETKEGRLIVRNKAH